MQQKELFKIAESAEETTDSSLRLCKSRLGWLDQFRITLRLDHLAITAILALVLYVLVFSFGVEKGRRFAFEELEARQTKETQLSSALSSPQEVLKERPPQPAEVTASSFSALPAAGSLSAPAVPKKAESAPANVSVLSLSSKVPSPSVTSKYTLQLITFVSQSRAEKEVERLKSLGLAAFVLPEGNKFQVCADSFESFKEAKERLMNLKKEGFIPPDAFIRPLNRQINI